jgi:hypothetical protein
MCWTIDHSKVALLPAFRPRAAQFESTGSGAQKGFTIAGGTQHSLHAPAAAP